MPYVFGFIVCGAILAVYGINSLAAKGISSEDETGMGKGGSEERSQ